MRQKTLEIYIAIKAVPSEEANFVWSIWSKNFPVETISTKINTQHLWNLCGSSHSVIIHIKIATVENHTAFVCLL